VKNYSLDEAGFSDAAEVAGRMTRQKFFKSERGEEVSNIRRERERGERQITLQRAAYQDTARIVLYARKKV